MSTLPGKSGFERTKNGKGTNMATLDMAKPGDTVTVAKLVGDGAARRRIMDMGVTKGTSVQVRKVAPLGDPVEITIRGYELTLRREEAQHVEIAS
jgi:ferrous iron transport protein A